MKHGSLLFYSLEALSILLIVVALFTAQINWLKRWIASKIGMKTSELKWQNLKDVLRDGHQLDRWTNRWRGLVANTVLFGIVAFAVLMIAAEAIPPQYLPAKKITERWWYMKPVPDVLPDNRWVITIMDKDDPRYGTDVTYDFCPEGRDKNGYSKLPFKEGAMVLVATYKEHGDCKELLHASLQRDDDKKIILKGIAQ